MRPRPWSTFLFVALVALALSAGCGGDELDGADHGDRIVVSDPVAGEPLGPPEDSSPTEVFFNHLLETKYCLEEWVGFTVSEPPPLESFLASGGTNWDPWQEAIERYGADAIGETCGRKLDLSYWEARFREAEQQEQRPLPPPSRDDFEAFYTFQRGLKACFEAHGFPLPDPPSLESFIASGATNWSPGALAALSSRKAGNSCSAAPRFSVQGHVSWRPLARSRPGRPRGTSRPRPL